MISANYLDYIYQRNWRTWAWAGMWALGMNLLLFFSMPNLLHQASSLPVFGTLVPQINVIRIKRSDTPVEQKVPKPPVKKKNRPPEPTFRQTVNQKFSMAFEINPKLPAGSTVLDLPIAPIDLDRLNLQNVFDIGDLDQPLTVLTRLPPFYPLAAKRKGIKGWVNVKFIVNEQGRVEDITVVDAQPPGIFDASVIRCMSGWRFKPGTVKGEAVKVWAETTIRFELE